jgi:hypothetical protein
LGLNYAHARASRQRIRGIGDDIFTRGQTREYLKGRAEIAARRDALECDPMVSTHDSYLQVGRPEEYGARWHTQTSGPLREFEMHLGVGARKEFATRVID